MTTVAPSSAPPDIERPTTRAVGARRENRDGLLLVSPTVLIVTVVVLLPVLWNFVLAFQKLSLLRIRTTGVFGPFTTVNFQKVFTDPDFWSSLWTTVLYSVFSTAGSIVVAGHVDSSAQGKGAFFRLDRLAPGDRMTLTGAGGRVREFRVVGRERYEKTKIPLEKYFALSGATRLTLITCGGPFDAATGHYRDNVVVTAVPI